VSEVADAIQIPVRSDADIVAARQAGRGLAAQIGFSGSALTVIAAAISEIARNIVEYAGEGTVDLSLVHQGSLVGIHVVARDRGPGIADVEKALLDGYSTRNSLGMGLPGARRLMDEFEVESRPGAGTTVTMTKWVR
jgi:serine/threonine-protein kinase RsbT